VEELQFKSLLACSDGSHCSITNTVSHSWVFASKVRRDFAKGAGPDNSLPTLMSSFCSELGGLLAIFYIIYRICQYYDVKDGKVTIYCDNKGALSKVFGTPQAGITPFLSTDCDLIELSHQFLQTLPVTYIYEWVKGHNDGKDKQYKHTLNHIADEVASGHRTHPPQGFTSKSRPLSHPGYKVHVHQGGLIITSQYFKQHLMAYQENQLIDYTLKKD
jgi:hypothetical protein